MNGVIRLMLLILSSASSLAVHAAVDAQALLHHTDRARGGGMPGIIWEITLTSREGDKIDEPQRVQVKATASASVAETLTPARSKGAKLLQIERNMWLTKTGLSKPIPISPRQRMNGQASNGDIAATNYAGDYDATLAGEEVVEGESCYILELTAKHKRTTYDRIRYWVAARREVGVKAEFYSVSGKLLKTARFEYGNTIQYEGRRIPFVSRMIIQDAMTPAETVMEYGTVTVQKIDPAEFDLGQLQ